MLLPDRALLHLQSVGANGATAQQVRAALGLNDVKSAKRVLRILRDAGSIVRFVVGAPRGCKADVRWHLVQR